jgi:hypothetical protein
MSMDAPTRTYVASLGEHAVALDVANDRYLMLAGGGRHARPDGPGPRGGRFIDAGLASRRPTVSMWPSHRFRVAPALVSLSCLRRVENTLEDGSFADLVDLVREAPTTGKPKVPAEEVLGSYFASRPFFSKPWICRLDAPALCLLMRRFGHSAELVFGARLEPFAAHCWAELDGVVLNEPIDYVGRFAPLLAV